MTTTGIGRLGVTFLDILLKDFAVNDEFLANKETGQIYYKNKNGEIIDLFETLSSNIDEERFAQLEEKVMEIIQGGGGSGSLSKLVHYTYNLTASTEGQDEFIIPLTTFDKDNDILFVNLDTSIPVKGIEYDIINDRTIKLNGGVVAGTILHLLIIKNVPRTTDEGEVSGNMFLDGSIPITKLDPVVQEKIENAGSGTIQVSTEDPPIDLPTNTLWYKITSEVGE